MTISALQPSALDISITISVIYPSARSQADGFSLFPVCKAAVWSLRRGSADEVEFELMQCW